MDIHKAKAWHGWREFLKEVGIIVLGVLIALAAEQTADALHWRHQVHEAENAMRLELQSDDEPQAVARVAIEKCLARQLDGIQAAIEDGADRMEVQQLADAYSPPRRTLDAEAWQAATSSQVASHMPASVMLAWSTPYRLMPGLGEANDREQRDLASLKAGRRRGGHASSSEEERWLLAIQNLRHDNDSMGYSSASLLSGAITAAPVPKQTEESVLREVRANFGACVVVPDLSAMNETSQLNPAEHR